MLQFDRARSCFLFSGTPIGPGVSASQLANALAVHVQRMANDSAWSFIQVEGQPVSAFVTFQEGRVHSGYFWSYVPSGGWEDYERAEQQRRAEHERIMEDLFGAMQFDNDAIHVHLVRDPRSGLEQISFQLR